MLFFGSGSAGAASFSSLYVLGDSLSDTGASSSSVLSIYNLLAGNCDPGHPCSPFSLLKWDEPISAFAKNLGSLILH